jgi:low temperature requirement protein LtrA
VTVDTGEDLRVSPLELFFDLVFVFAIAQVAGVLRAQPDAAGYLRGALLLALLWWAWSQYTWALNAVGNERLPVRLALMAAAGVALVMAVTVPAAFGDAGLGFGLAYLGVRWLGLAVYWGGLSPGDEGRAGLRRFTPLAATAPLVVVAGSLLGGDARTAAFALALAVEVGAALASGRRVFRIRPGHFAERYGLFVIIALGEAIVAIGLGATEHPLDLALAAAMAVTFAAAGLLWWSYFDWVAPAAEQGLRTATGEERSRLARDVYTLFHYPIAAGIVLFAVAAEAIVAHPLDRAPALTRATLAGGFVLFLLGFLLGHRRSTGRLLPERLGASVAIAVLAAAAGELPGVLLLALVDLVLVAALLLEARAGRGRRGAVTAPA